MWDIKGEGSPEGNRAAAPGTRYTDTLATGGTVLWVKASGHGATGWTTPAAVNTARVAALEYDSGLRDVTSLAGANVASGQLLLRRTGRTVTLEFVSVSPSASYATGSSMFTLPSGFRRPGPQWWGWLPASGTIARSAFMFSSGGFGVYVPGTTDSYRHSITWTTNDTAPATLPGTPA